MGLQNHTFRRGATYVWRRRLPTRLGAGIIQISLRTNDPLIARRLSVIVNAEAVRIFDVMQAQGLTKDEARHFLAKVIERELRRMETLRVIALNDPSPETVILAAKQDRAIGRAFQILAEKGAGAAHFGEAEAEALLSEGFDQEDLHLILTTIDQQVTAFSQTLSEGRHSPATALMRDYLDRDQFNQVEVMQGRQLYYRGKATALQSQGAPDGAKDDAQDILARLKAGTWIEPLAKPAPQPKHSTEDAKPYPIATEPAAAPRQNREPKPAPSSNPSKAPKTHNGFDPSVMAVAERLLTQKSRQKMSATEVEQRRRFYALFVEATGITDIRDLNQSHLAHFVDLLHELPATYRKSPKDREKTLRQIIKDAPKDAKRLSESTINRNLDHVGQLLTKAKSEGFTNVAFLDVTSLRLRKTVRERDERPAFTAAEVQTVFKHPIWHGFRNLKDWHTAGTRFYQNGIYWVPLIAALSGARREEIAALMVQDIIEIDGIPCMRIRPNDNRRIKNLSSKRDVPLHPQLIELGFLDHVQKQRASKKGELADIFPDLRTKSERTSFGDAIDYRFRELVKHQLNGNPEGKVFHSLRHYVTTQLGRLPNVAEATRKDILGHVGDSITAERYSEGTPVADMLAAISQLPRLPVRGAARK